MAEIPDVHPGDRILSSWGNALRDRTWQRFADEPSRDQLWPSPADGAHCVTADPPARWWFTSGAWQLLPSDGDALTEHEAQPATAGAHGLTEHTWATDAWAGFDAVPFTSQGAAEFTTTVESGRGHIQGDASDTGNRRTWWLREDTEAAYSEVTSIWWQPGPGEGAGPQCGHIHRAQQINVDGADYNVAFVCWLNVSFGGIPNILLNVWQAPVGSTSEMATGAKASGGDFTNLAVLENSQRVRTVTRLNFGGWIQSYRVDDPAALGVATGETVDVLGASELHWLAPIEGDPEGRYDLAPVDANATAAAVGGVDNAGGVIHAEAPDQEGPGWGPTLTGAGRIRPSGIARRSWPRVVTSRLVGATLAVKVHRLGASDPGWSDAHTATATITTEGSEVHQLPEGPGRSGLLGAHLIDGRFVEYGDVRFAKLA